MKNPRTLTKKQLIDAMEDLRDDAKIVFTFECSDLTKAKENGLCNEIEKGHEQYVLGLPGDASSDKDGIAFMLWAEVE